VTEDKKPSRKIYPSDTFFEPVRVASLKRDVIRLLESLTVVNLTQAADKLGVPRTLLHRWRKEDPEWLKELDLCNEVIADKMEEEMMQLIVDGKIINQAYFLARMARLKALRPGKYREKFGIDVTDSRVPELLAELRAAGKKKDPCPEDSTTKE
jgi:hypothetical protein